MPLLKLLVPFQFRIHGYRPDDIFGLFVLFLQKYKKRQRQHKNDKINNNNNNKNNNNNNAKGNYTLAIVCMPLYIQDIEHTYARNAHTGVCRCIYA